MRILMIHNRHRVVAPSGENVVYALELDLLREHGHAVQEFVCEIPGPSVYRGLLATRGGNPIWNFSAAKALKRRCRRYKPDVVHVHNTFPVLSPSVFYAVHEESQATVFTLHNYRVYCASGGFLRNGAICRECYERASVWPALTRRCYRGSIVGTLAAAASIWLHRRLHTYTRLVDGFIVPSSFARGLLVSADVPRERTYVKPHSYPPGWSPLPWEARQHKAVFVGRVERAKGVWSLIEAWRYLGAEAPTLEVLGDGPDFRALGEHVRRLGLGGRVLLRGMVDRTEVRNALATGKLLLAPSSWYESFGMSIVEAMALGVPVIASKVGAYEEIVVDGVTGVMVEPGETGELAQTVAALWSNQNRLRQMALAARAVAEREYSPEISYRRLLQVYEAAIENRMRARASQGH